MQCAVRFEFFCSIAGEDFLFSYVLQGLISHLALKKKHLQKTSTLQVNLLFFIQYLKQVGQCGSVGFSVNSLPKVNSPVPWS